MIEALLQLRCDNCKETFDESEDQQFDSDLFTPTEVRKIASRKGWKLLDGMDICPSCSASLTKRQKVKP